MKRKPPVPRERTETIRKTIIRLLEAENLTAGDLSKQIHRSEKEIHDHLEHLGKAGILKIVPAECRGCGYVFESRNRPRKPGKCPRCKSTFIEDPLFSVRKKNS